MNKYRKIDLFAMEIGSGLCEKDMLDDILMIMHGIRKNIFYEFGVAIPSIAVMRNKKLNPLEYAIKVSGIRVSRYELKKDSVLIIENKSVKSRMRGTSTTDPASNHQALWIPAERKDVAEERGYTVELPQEIIMDHLIGIIMDNITRVITIQYVKELMDEVAVENEALCSHISRKYEKNTLSVVKNVLSYLLDDGCSIIDIITILEGIASEKSIEEISRDLEPHNGKPKPMERVSDERFRQLQKQLLSILDKMQPQEREILSMRFGLNGEKCHTLEEVGQSFSISRERIRQIEAKAMVLIKRNC